jgi:hypothetical protein
VPHNKSEKINNQQNHDALKEEAVNVKSDKMQARSPNMNGINKNNET